MTSCCDAQDGHAHEGMVVGVVAVCLISINFDTNILAIVQSKCTELLEADFLFLKVRML